ncbi:DUF6884 domain-containing protein [Halapricum desulfuricans]|nr:DUF6884 domain-containing protein [Halapricum desulfuricans]
MKGRNRMDIGLVSCTKKKQEQASIPAELYMESLYFRKMRKFCEENHGRWYILSAKYGVLEPYGEVIEAYNETLRDSTVKEKREWAKSVFEQLQAMESLEKDTTLFIHAGKDYYGELLPLLEQTDAEVRIPTEGLGLGEKMAWYNDRI